MAEAAFRRRLHGRRRLPQSPLGFRIEDLPPRRRTMASVQTDIADAARNALAAGYLGEEMLEILGDGEHVPLLGRRR